MSDAVKVYTTPTCPYCTKVKDFLKERGIEFTAYDVSQDREALKEMIEISNSRSVPVISACNEVMIGFDEGKLTQMLNCIEQRTEVTEVKE